jgi:hypothetical protein
MQKRAKKDIRKEKKTENTKVVMNRKKNTKEK